MANATYRNTRFTHDVLSFGARDPELVLFKLVPVFVRGVSLLCFLCERLPG